MDIFHSSALRGRNVSCACESVYVCVCISKAHTRELPIFLFLVLFPARFHLPQTPPHGGCFTDGATFSSSIIRCCLFSSRVFIEIAFLILLFPPRFFAFSLLFSLRPSVDTDFPHRPNEQQQHQQQLLAGKTLHTYGTHTKNACGNGNSPFLPFFPFFLCVLFCGGNANCVVCSFVRLVRSFLPLAQTRTWPSGDQHIFRSLCFAVCP